MLLGLTVLLGGCSQSPPTLSLLVWEGYADGSFVKGFEEQCQCKVTASYMGSSDELVAKLRGGSAANYDVISPSSDVATSLVNAGLTAQLDLSKIPSYADISEKLKNLPLVRKDSAVFGVPFVWGPNPLLYNTKAFDGKTPASWSVLWDKKYLGKVSVWDDLSTVYLAAQVLGYDQPDPSAIYNLSDEQLLNVKKKLIELKPNVRKIWATGGELTNLFQNNEIVAAMGWPLMTTELRKVNFPIGETIPKENTTGWIDHLMITAASKQKVLAHQFLEYMIQAKTQKLVVDVTGYVPANPKTAALLTAQQKTDLNLGDSDSYMAKIYFWQDVPRRARYLEVWNEVKAAQ
jgi:spermidine/putrescine-binding protein